MNKFNNNEKKSEAIKLISEIITVYNNDKIQEIPQKCNTLVRHFYSHPDILYSDLNEYFESSGLLKVLIAVLDKVQEIPKRDLLRLLHLLLQVSRSLRDESRKSKDLQAFLLKTLDQNICWENGIKFKHHINIASLLLIDRDGCTCPYNNASVRRLARASIEEIIKRNQQEEDDAFPILIFYACSMFTSTFEDLPKVLFDKCASESILNKSSIAKYSDILRDYIREFKIFYETVDKIDRTNFNYYKPNSGFSFQQLSNTFIYYAIQSEKVRMNILQSGNYGMINNLFAIKYVPESILLCGFDFLNLSLLDEIVLKSLKDNFQNLIPDKLNSIIKRETLSEKTKIALQYFLEIYDTSRNNSIDSSTENIVKPPRKKEEESSLIHITNINVKDDSVSDSFGFERWGTIDVQEWLADKNLEELRNKCNHLTGQGLKQLKNLTKESNKMNLIDFLMKKMESSFDVTLELIGAIELL